MGGLASGAVGSPLDLITAAVRGDPVLDIAATHALLRAVAAGERAPALRVFVPGPTAAFGRLDVLRPGFRDAAAAARQLGLVPVVRPAGGHAAVYGPGAVVVEHVSAEADVTAGLQERFADQSRRLRDALAGLGADARIGELPGEYCAGRDSVNLGGRIKVAGIAQRAIRGGALTTAVVTVENGPALRTAIAALYGALELEVDPSAAGTVDEALPGIRAADVAAAVVSAYAPTAAAALDDALLDRARGLAARHHVA